MGLNGYQYLFEVYLRRLQLHWEYGTEISVILQGPTVSWQAACCAADASVRTKVPSPHRIRSRTLFSFWRIRAQRLSVAVSDMHRPQRRRCHITAWGSMYTQQSWSKQNMIFGRTVEYSLYNPYSIYFRVGVDLQISGGYLARGS